MEMYKNENKAGKNELFIGDETNGFIIGYGGSDFYWVLKDHRACNRFVISKENKNLYSVFKKLFSNIKKSDNKYCPTIKNDVFEWISEARPPEISNKLIISKEENEYVIDFIKNPQDILGSESCAICFCLSGSRNEKIAFDFAMMFQDVIYEKTNDIGCQKALKNMAFK